MLDFSTPMADCLDGELRLVNGSDEREGRLEICFNRAWGTICRDEFNQTEATVACGQLGFSREGAVLHTYIMINRICMICTIAISYGMCVCTDIDIYTIRQ